MSSPSPVEVGAVRRQGRPFEFGEQVGGVAEPAGGEHDGGRRASGPSGPSGTVTPVTAPASVRSPVTRAAAPHFDPSGAGVGFEQAAQRPQDRGAARRLGGVDGAGRGVRLVPVHDARGRRVDLVARVEEPFQDGGLLGEGEPEEVLARGAPADPPDVGEVPSGVVGDAAFPLGGEASGRQVPAGVRQRPADVRGLLQDEHARARRGRLDGAGEPARAGPDDDRIERHDAPCSADGHSVSFSGRTGQGSALRAYAKRCFH
nr:hypothetical protein [Actinomadura sp. CNU-125]